MPDAPHRLSGACEFDVLEHQGLPSPQVKLIQLLPAPARHAHIGLDADTVVPVQLLP